MSVRRAFAFASALATIALAGCSTAAPVSNDQAAGSPDAPAPIPASGVAIAIGRASTSNTKMVDVFDTARHILLSRFSAGPGSDAQVGQIVVARDGRHVYLTAYNTSDPVNTHAGLYIVDLGSATANYYRSLGPGEPIDATLTHDNLLQVIMHDPSPSDPRATTRIISIDTVTNMIQTFSNPLPARPDGTVPAPTSIASDPGRGLTYMTDEGGTIYALNSQTMQYYRGIPSATPLFLGVTASIAFDPHRSVVYQLGTFKTVDDHQRYHLLGALLTTSVRDGTSHLATFPYVPVGSALLDRTGANLFFGSTYSPTPATLYVSRLDIGTSHYVSRPIVYGRPEFLVTGKLAFSNDGAHLLLPVSTGSDATLAGALLEMDPVSLHLQNSADAPDQFESGGVIAI